MREKIRAFTEKHPIVFHLVFMVFYCGIYMFYHGAVQPDPNYDWDITFLRLAITFATLLFMREIYYGRFHFGFTMRNGKKCLLLLWPLILFGVLNFLMSFSVLFSGLPIVWYSFIMVVLRYTVTGLYEEVGIRGVLVNHMMRVNRHKKHGIRYAVLMSSFLFGIVHINNIIRTGPMAIVQCIYAFAIGVVFAAAYLRTRNLWVCIILHAIFDIIGSMTNLYVYPGAALPDYPRFGLEVILNTGVVSLSAFAILSVVCIIAGLYMIRPAKQGAIMRLWRRELEG